MIFKRRESKRYPLKQKPLRNPGESLDREIERLFEEELLPYGALAVFAVLFTAYEWWRWFTQSPPQPVPLTIIALAITGFTVYKVLSLRRIIPSMQLGLEGEKVVGQYLEEFRASGYRVFHDIPGGGFNLDHVVISPHGIFVIETKTYSKPARGDATIKFDGERIFVNGAEPDRNPVGEVYALANWLQNLLFEKTGRRFPTKAVIVFPGWFVEPTPQAKKRADLWVLNPKALPSFIPNEPVVLKSEDVALAASTISDYVQAHL